MKTAKVKKPEIVHDFTEEKKGRHIKIKENDLLIIHVSGAGQTKIKREQFINLRVNNRITQYLISDIKYYKNKSFRAELIFIKWLD